MKIAVLGAGAIGAYVGAALSRGGAEVTLIARGPHLEAMQKHGVKVVSPRGDFEATPTVTDDIEAVGEADTVFLGLKAYSFPEVAPRLKPALGRETSVIAAQNGIPWWYFQHEGGVLDGTIVEAVDPNGVITRSIEPRRVIGCVIYCSTEIATPGVIRHVEGTRFSIGEPTGEISERCRQIANAFAAGGLKCPIDEQLRAQIWLKLIGNVAFNPVSVLTGATLGELGSSDEMLALLRNILTEAASVARRLGIELPVSLERRLEAGIAVGDHRTSMLQDFEAGKHLELDCLTGAVLELGRRLDIPLPYIQTLHACAALRATLRTQSARPLHTP